MLSQNKIKFIFCILLTMVYYSCSNSTQNFEDEDDEIYNNYGNLLFCPKAYTDAWDGKKPTPQQLAYFKNVVCQSCIAGVHKGNNEINMRFITVDVLQKKCDTVYITPVFKAKKLQYRHRYSEFHSESYGWHEMGLAKGYINGKKQGTIFFDNHAYFKMSSTFNIIIELYVVPPENLRIHNDGTENRITLMEKYLDMHKEK